MKYSRPGPTQPEIEKIRERMGGKNEPNAATLPGSEPSRPLTDAQQTIANANKAAREANLKAHREKLAAAAASATPVAPAQGKPVTGTPVPPKPAAIPPATGAK